MAVAYDRILEYFSTAAPTVTFPRNPEPGGGANIWSGANSENKLSIAPTAGAGTVNALICSGKAAAADDPRFVTDTTFPREAGRVVAARIQASQMRIGVGTSATIVPTGTAVGVSAPGLSVTINGVTFLIDLNLIAGVFYDIIINLQLKGSHILVKAPNGDDANFLTWKMVYRDHTRTDTNLYAGFGVTSSSAAWKIASPRVAKVTGEIFATEHGLDSFFQAGAMAAGALFTSEANYCLMFDQTTRLTGGQFKIIFSKVDANNYQFLTIDPGAGAVNWYEVAAGVTSPAKGTFASSASGHHFVIKRVGTSGWLVINGQVRMTITGLVSNGTGIEVTSVGTGGLYSDALVANRNVADINIPAGLFASVSLSSTGGTNGRGDHAAPSVQTKFVITGLGTQYLTTLPDITLPVAPAGTTKDHQQIISDTEIWVWVNAGAALGAGQFLDPSTGQVLNWVVANRGYPNSLIAAVPAKFWPGPGHVTQSGWIQPWTGGVCLFGVTNTANVQWHFNMAALNGDPTAVGFYPIIGYAINGGQKVEVPTDSTHVDYSIGAGLSLGSQYFYELWLKDVSGSGMDKWITPVSALFGEYLILDAGGVFLDLPVMDYAICLGDSRTRASRPTEVGAAAEFRARHSWPRHLCRLLGVRDVQIGDGGVGWDTGGYRATRLHNPRLPTGTPHERDYDQMWRWTFQGQDRYNLIRGAKYHFCFVGVNDVRVNSDPASVRDSVRFKLRDYREYRTYPNNQYFLFVDYHDWEHTAGTMQGTIEEGFNLHLADFPAAAADTHLCFFNPLVVQDVSTAMGGAPNLNSPDGLHGGDAIEMAYAMDAHRLVDAIINPVSTGGGRRGQLPRGR